MTLAVTATPNEAGAYIELTVSGMQTISPQYEFLLITRNMPDGSVAVVRGADGTDSVGAVDTVVLFDQEAPLNVPITYNITAIRNDTGGGQTTGSPTAAAAVTIPLAALSVWVKSVSTPSLSLEMSLSAMDAPTYPTRQQVNPVIGAKFPVVLSDVQGARTGSFTFRTDTLSDRAAFLQLINSGTTLFFQADSNVTMGDGFEDCYFVPGAVVENRPAASSKDPTRLWNVPFTEVASPAGALTAIPTNSWLLVTDFGTWADLAAARSTWLDVLNTPYGS